MNELRIPTGDRAAAKRGGAVAHVDQFHPASTSHRPKTTCRLTHDGKTIHLRFDVRDRYVRCLKRPFQGRVYMDSCVEFFVWPKPRKGYFNFEFNCGGQMLVYYIKDWRRNKKRKMQEFTPLTQADVSPLNVTTKLSAPIDPEIATPTNWWLEASIPVSLLEKYVGPLGDLSGQTWRANFQKCASIVSNPHWATWNSIGEDKNFHQPDKFGKLIFS
jgi:hypothetical protein